MCTAEKFASWIATLALMLTWGVALATLWACWKALTM